jgi:hypothetical protein
MTDKELLDSLADDLDSKEPFPERMYLLELRGRLRDSGRVCVDPPAPPVDPRPSGY